MAVLLLLVFAGFAYLMIFRKFPSLAALPLMAVLIYGLAALGFFLVADAATLDRCCHAHPEVASLTVEKLAEILGRTRGDALTSLGFALSGLFQQVFEIGPGRLAGAMITVVLGSTLAKLVEERGIAQGMVRAAAELSGDKPVVVALLLSLVAAALFTVLGGLGAVIMVGSIVFPVWLSVGLSPIVASCCFLLALSLGGVLNPVNWQVYTDVLGLEQKTVLGFALPFAALFALVLVVFILVEQKREGVYRYWSLPTPPEGAQPGWHEFLVPLLPVALLVIFRHAKAYDGGPLMPINAAFLIAIASGVLLSFGSRRVQLLLKCAFEGIKDVAPVLLLMMGIGMLVTATMSLPVVYFMQPLLLKVTPSSPATYLAFFGLLAPLALYRGPFNVWGMGFGVAALLLGTGKLPPAALMGALLSVGMIQGVCDPTNTHNVWVANQLKTDLIAILKRTLPYMWALALGGLLLSTVRFF